MKRRWVVISFLFVVLVFLCSLISDTQAQWWRTRDKGKSKTKEKFKAEMKQEEVKEEEIGVRGEIDDVAAEVTPAPVGARVPPPSIVYEPVSPPKDIHIITPEERHVVTPYAPEPMEIEEEEAMPVPSSVIKGPKLYTEPGSATVDNLSGE